MTIQMSQVIKPNFPIVDRESHTIAETIKKAVLIRVSDSSLKNNIGKYQLPTYGMRSCSDLHLK